MLERLERQLSTAGVRRVGVAARPLDGRLFRAVGEEHRPGLGDGEVSRVLRATLLQGDRVLRDARFEPALELAAKAAAEEQIVERAIEVYSRLSLEEALALAGPGSAVEPGRE